MEPISSATILTGLAINFASDIIVSGFKSFQDTSIAEDLELAYDNALKKWTRNSQIRHTHEHLSKHKFEQLLNSLSGFELNLDIEAKRFIEIFKNEICDKKYQSLYQHINLELQKKQIDLLQEIRNNQNLSIGPIPELKIFPEPTCHIERTVYGYSNSTSLVEIIKNEHAVALLGEGGMGKTTELDYVASILSKDGWYCGLVRLINYASSLEKLIESQFQHWQNIPASSKVLILLDGLDEVSSSNISTAENEIIEVTKIHKNVHFLISYRNSYSLFLSLNDKKGESNEMVRVTLDPISIEFVTKYIQDNANNPIDVIGQFQRQNLFEICKNPFYLANYIEIINETGNVPDNKSDFFEKILSTRFRSERQKGHEVTREVKRREKDLRMKLEELALTMQLAGKYQIENCDILEIIDDPDLLETSRRIVLYETGITDLENWRFEHNNFQEYLAAKKLSKCSWEQMQSLLFLPNKKLKPKWYNAISFLINQLDQKGEQHRQLVEWLIENDRIAFVKLEVVHFDQVIRNQVFYSIYNYYKEKEIVFYAEFLAQDIAKFSDLENNPELIDFLLRELQPEMNIQNLYNIVELFQSIRPIQQGEIDRIAIALSRYLKNEEYNNYNINASVLETYIKWEWQNEDIFNDLLNEDVLIKDGSTRSNLLRYLQKNQTSLLTASLILKCLKIRLTDSIHTFDIYSIKEAISALSELEIVRLLDELTLRNENDLTRKQKGDFINVVKAIEERASILYPMHKEILPAVNQFVLATLDHVYPADAAHEIKPFYEKNNLVLPLFMESILKEQNWPDAKAHCTFKFSGYLANEECVSWIVEEYQQEKISDIDIRYLRISMAYYRNGNGYQLLTEQMNAITNETFFPNTPDLYTETHNKTEELYARAILNKEQYIGYIEKAFKYFDKDEITKNDFWNRQNQNDHIYDIDFQTCHRCLRDFIDNDKITTKQEVLTFINTYLDWKGFQLTEHYELSQNGELQKENIEWIVNWCQEHEHEIDFKNAITEDENGYINLNKSATYYIQFCINTDYFPQSKQLLLDLTSCLSYLDYGPRKSNKTRNNYTLYEYLESHLLNDEINQRVIQNLKDGIEADMVLNEHLKIIENENLIGAEVYLPHYILNRRWKKWTCYKLLSVYFQLNGAVENVKGILNDISFNDENNVDWQIIDEFIKRDQSISSAKLLEFNKNDKIDKYKLAVSLIKCGRTEGLDLLYQILKEKNNNGKHDEFRIGEFESFVKNGGFKGEDSIPRLTDLILVHLHPEFKNDKWSNTISQLFNLLAFYFNARSQTLMEVELRRIEDALLKAGKNTMYQLVYRSYQKLRLELDVLLDSECEIEAAQQKLKENGVA